LEWSELHLCCALGMGKSLISTLCETKTLESLKALHFCAMKTSEARFWLSTISMELRLTVFCC